MDVLGFPQTDHPRHDPGELTLKPFDARLVRYAPATRKFLVAGAVLSVLRATGAILLTHGLAFGVTRFSGESVGRFLCEATVGLILLSAGQWATDTVAVVLGNRVTAELRERALRQYRNLESRHSNDVATLMTDGIDAVARYISGFLPAVIAMAVFTPIVTIAIGVADPLSGIAVAVTLPLIPLFMVLIGKSTQATQTAQWVALSRLSTGFTEIAGGITTLLLFGRESRQTARIRAVTHGYRERTMKVLRLSFLSSFALEVGSSLAVAVVAVSIGIRLVSGAIGLDVGLWVLILVPEAFSAIRLVGARFHASADGLSVANDVFDLTQAFNESRQSGDGSRELRIEGAAIPGRLARTKWSAQHSTVTVISGPSGSGKSTLLDVIRGELAAEGTVLLDGEAVTPADISWAPQQPLLIGRFVRDAVMLGAPPETREDQVANALRLAAVDVELTRQIDTLSGGQAQRVSLARAYLRALTRHTPIVLLDEPTSALDESSEHAVIAGIREMAGLGRIVIVASHRDHVRDSADALVGVTTP